MNREILLEVAIAVTVGLLIAVLAAYRSSNPVTPGASRRAGMTGLLVYAVIAAGVLVGNGLTLIGLVVLLALIALPLVGRSRTGEPSGPMQLGLVAMVWVGLAAAMLIAAGQTLALLGRIDPRAVVLVIAVIAVLLLAGQGWAAAGRIGSTTLWILVVPIVLSLALGVFLGAPAQAVDPIVAVPGLDWWAVLGLAVAFLALGAAGFGRQSASPVRVWGGAALVVALIALGQLMFLGGAMISPSLQFFVLPANLDIVPGLAGVLLAVLTVVFTALVVLPLAGLTERPRLWLPLGGAVAVIVALADPGLDRVVVVAALFGAVLLGAENRERPAIAGAVVAVVATAVLALLGDLTFGWASALAMLAVAGVARLMPASA